MFGSIVNWNNNSKSITLYYQFRTKDETMNRVSIQLNLLIYISIIFYSSTAFAIDETESLRQRSQDKSSFTNLALDLSGRNGNSDSENIALGLYHSLRKDQHFGFVQASREYETSNGTESANNRFLHLRYNYYFKSDQSMEVFLQTNVDDFRQLESRDLIGIGYRKEIDRAQAFGIGLFKEQEAYSVNNQTKRFEQTRMNLYWVYAHEINEYAMLSNTLYYQPNVSGVNDWRAFNQLSVRSKVSENVFLKFDLLIKHDSQPVLNVARTDTSYGAGFEWEF